MSKTALPFYRLVLQLLVHMLHTRIPVLQLSRSFVGLQLVMYTEPMIRFISPHLYLAWYTKIVAAVAKPNILPPFLAVLDPWTSHCAYKLNINEKVHKRWYDIGFKNLPWPPQVIYKIGIRQLILYASQKCSQIAWGPQTMHFSPTTATKKTWAVWSLFYILLVLPRLYLPWSGWCTLHWYELFGVIIRCMFLLWCWLFSIWLAILPVTTGFHGNWLRWRHKGLTWWPYILMFNLRRNDKTVTTFASLIHHFKIR